MKNYTNETFLKGFVAPLSKYLWTGQTTYNSQKSNAELIVNNDFVSKGYRNSFIQVPLVLRESETISANETGLAIEDNLVRMRYVYTVSVFTGTAKTIVLMGCNEEDGTFETVNTFTITSTSANMTGIISDSYKYYKLVSTVPDGTLNFTFKLVETSYDLFFAYKWLELILMDSFKEENDQYYLKMIEFRKMYNDLWNNVVINEDTDEDGTYDDSYQQITLAP
jgi:hypothetical protein